MNDLRLSATEDLARILLARGDPHEVVNLLAEIADGHPVRESLAALHIRALHAAGRRYEAIAVYQRTRAHLTSHLGVDPTDSLEDAYRAVLHGQTPTPTQAAAHPKLAQLPADTATFTGRRAELGHLLSFVPDNTTQSHAGGVVVICAVDGMGGIGKPNP